MNEDLTIIEIEQIEGIEYDHEYYHEHLSKYGLPVWYHNIRSKKISQFSDGDLARSIRQKIFVKYIMPECIIRLSQNPFRGHILDGELLKAMAENVDDSFWQENEIFRNKIFEIINYANQNDLLAKDELIEEWEKEEIQGWITILEKKLNPV